MSHARPVKDIDCCCVEDLVAMIQACIDQSVGLLTLWEAEAIQPTSEQLKRHYTKLGALLQAAVDGYTQHHGKPDVLHDVEAAEWLVRMLSQ